MLGHRDPDLSAGGRALALAEEQLQERPELLAEILGFGAALDECRLAVARARETGSP